MAVQSSTAAGSFFATIKTELIHRNSFKTRNEARLSVFKYIEGFYNPVRRHSALDYKSPEVCERMLEVKVETEAIRRCLKSGRQWKRGKSMEMEREIVNSRSLPKRRSQE